MTTKVPVELSSTPGIVDGSNATAITIDSSERVGIGNASPTEILTLGTTSDANTRIAIQSADDGAGTIQFADGTSAAAYAGYINYTHSDNALAFATASTERMRIDSSGNVGIGNTAPADLSENGFYVYDGGLNTYHVRNNTSGSTYHVYASSAFKFYVQYSGNIYATNTTVQGISDERLKENIKDLDQGLSDVLKLKPRKYDWKEGEGSGEKNVSGFVAQEAETAGFGEFVSGFKHNTLSDAKSFGPGGLIPVLTKAIQELSAKNDALEARIKTLEDA